MKLSKIPIARTGLFVILCFSLLIVLLFVIGNKQKLFSNTAHYYIKFKEVSGLKEGAQVQISGINVGSVAQVELPAKAGDSVLLTINVVTSATNLIHTDSRAKIVTEGLVGNKGVAISIGSKNTTILGPESFILGESGPELMSIVDSATGIVNTTKELLGNLNKLVININEGKGTLGSLLTKEDLYSDLVKTIESTNRLMGTISTSIDNANSSLKSITDDAQKSASAVSDILENIKQGNGTVGHLLKDSSLYVQLEASLKNLTVSLTDVMNKLSASAGNAQEVTEALKHNFLVKGYFEDRGYWDAASYEATISRKLDSIKMIENRLRSLK